MRASLHTIYGVRLAARAQHRLKARTFRCDILLIYILAVHTLVTDCSQFVYTLAIYWKQNAVTLNGISRSAENADRSHASLELGRGAGFRRGWDMKEVMAVVRPERREATLEAMRKAGINDVLHLRVMGRGRQQGLQYLRRAQGEMEAGMTYLSKRMVSWLVPDEQVAETVRTLIRVNQTGNHGDGKIFVCPVVEAVLGLTVSSNPRDEA